MFEKFFEKILEIFWKIFGERLKNNFSKTLKTLCKKKNSKKFRNEMKLLKFLKNFWKLFLEKLSNRRIRENLKEKFVCFTEMKNSIKNTISIRGLSQQVLVSDRSKCLFIDCHTL